MRLKISLHFLWFDFWVGAFFDRTKRTLYICPLPMCVIKIVICHGKDEPVLCLHNDHWNDCPDCRH